MPCTRFLWLASALMLGMMVASCTDSVTNPQVGSGTLLDASVNGTAVSIDPDEVGGFNTYTTSTHEVRVGGTLTGSTSKTITLRFVHDIDNGSLPHTLTGDAVSINYLEVGASTLIYDCPLVGGNCTITVTAVGNNIVDGTFSATLAERNDPTKTVAITNGRFSVKLQRN